MKALKLVIINAVTLIIGLGLLSGFLSRGTVQAARFESIPAMKINKLGHLKGQYLTVLYAVGSRPFLSKDSSKINISQIKESRTVYITADTMSLPAAQVAKEGFRPSYNIVVFVVSPQQNYSWVNEDGSIPQGASSTKNQLRSVANSINKSDVEAFIASAGEGTPLQVNLNNLIARL